MWRPILAVSLYSLVTIFAGWCEPSVTATPEPVAEATLSTPAASPVESTTIADAATILQKQEVPILCYHQVRDWRPDDSPTARAYIVPPAAFTQQMQALADSGYQTILPDQLLDYLQKGKALPAKPVMLTFDDSRLDQYTTALPVMDKHGFKAAFFIMTVSLGRPGYMSNEQVKELSDAGHSIGSHTWDHHNVKKYQGQDWVTQVEKPSQQLEKITGKKIEYFAYPFGLWNREAIPHLKEHNLKAAFQLADKMDPDDPLFSIRRIIVPGSWSGDRLLKTMRGSFAKK